MQPARISSVPSLAAVGDGRQPLLDRELRQVLRSGPFSAALHLAIESKGWTLERLQRALLARGVGVSLSTLSYWRRGRSRPERPDSLRAVDVLEELLDLPRESLTSLLGPRRRRGRWLDHPAGAAPLAKLWQHPEDLAKLYTGFSEAPNDHLTRLSICDDYHVGAQRQASSLVCRMVVRAEADRVARCLAVLWSEKRDGSQPAISRTRYCRLGRIRDEESSGYTIAELVLDRVLGRGDCAVLEYEVTMPRQTEESDEFSRRFTAPIRQYALSVTFHPDALPTRCHAYQRLAVDSPDRWADELWPAANTVQTVASDVPPGLVGIRWEWE